MGLPVLLKNATDSYVSEKYPARNYNTVNRLYLADNSAADTRYAYMYFGVPSGMAKTTIISAKLRLYSGAGFTGSVTMTVQRLAAKFTATTVNWSNKPGVTGTAVNVTKSSAATNTMWEFDVTSMMQQVANGAAWYGVRISATNSTAKWIHSAQAVAAYRPELEITWSDAPDAPEVLIPSGGTMVSVAKPTLQWDFTDPSGDTTMQAFDLKLFSSLALANANGAGDVLNLTSVASDIPQLDLDDTAYAGTTDLASVWWRVRVQDGAGLWSGWSAVATWTRKTKGTLTITNPAAPSNNFVSEPTPPFTWTFTGRTQRAYEVLLSTPETPSVYIWRSGIVTSTATSVTPPPGKITQNGKTYTLIVRIYDTENRRSIPDDPIYTEVTRDFTYNLSATVATVTGFTVTPDVARPKAVLAWSRTTAPDTFIIYRDGKVIDEVYPVEVFVSGTSYAFTDLDASPRSQHTWSVAAKVNGVVSSSNPTAVGTVKPVTTVLCLPDSSKMVFLFNPDVAAERAESSEIHYILGSAPPVLVTQSLRGYEGSISGVLADDVVSGETASGQLAHLEYFKQNPGIKLKLIWIDKVMTVVIRNVTDSPVAYPSGKVDYLVSFDFFEVDF
jgi:hypothetical protein